ncbi:hypothetical protein OSB04_025945 [Centaurea solstitialis]|uniref:RWP-RK domain-containing protein n=1 Tax=Centaurea solstitialis TaxID=347529 RepID=A0AA38SPL9_9ASTR|nr:hypothetical protein OSB04_025945 [Centaurea solstitialis]
MDPQPANHDQNPNENDLYNWFEETPPLPGENETMEDESCKLLDIYNLEMLNQVPEVDQINYMISDFDPLDDLSLWDWCDIITDFQPIDHDWNNVTSGEAYKPIDRNNGSNDDIDIVVTSGSGGDQDNKSTDEGGKYGSCYWWDDILPILSCNDDHEDKRITISDDDLKQPIMDHHHLHVNTSDKEKSSTGRKPQGMRSGPLSLEDIEKHFEKPITMAAKELNVGLTVLKKRCRQLNINRWPHRKLRSLKSLIQNVKEMGLHEEMEMLEEHKRMIEKEPETELTQKTKKLRQACYKSNYKKRRLLNQSPPYPC